MIKRIFNVRWEESFSVKVEAKSREEAEEMIMNGEYNEKQASSEISSGPEALEF